MNYKDLQSDGLSETEAKIYLAVLELGETVVSRIAKKSGVKRTTVYLSLENLKEKGLLSQIKKHGRPYYYAEDPRKLEELLEEKKNKISKLMPELMAIANVIDKKPVIRYFEGQESFKEVFNETLGYPNQETLVWFPNDEHWLDNEYFTKEYVPRRLTKKISTRAIVPESSKNMSFFETNQEALRQVRIAPNDVYVSKIEIVLYGKNKIGIVSFYENMSVIIESPNIFEALRSIFNVMWEKLPG
jgi:sugar-specific transcriptional regulator TrmB